MLELLATAVQANDYKWFIVTDSEPVAGLRALSPSVIKDKGLDTLHVITREEADRLGVEVPTRTVSTKTFTASGPGGAAFQQIVDQVADFTIQTISKLSVKVTADEAKGTQDLDLAVAALGMLQQYAITVRSTVVAEYKGVNGGLQFAGSADRADFQVAYNHAKKALAGATKVAGDPGPRPDVRPARRGHERGPVVQLHNVIKNLQMQSTNIAAEVTK